MKQVVIGNFMNNIIWLASYPKSGNTLLRSILYAAVNDKFDLNRLGEFSPSFASVASLQGNGLLNLECIYQQTIFSPLQKSSNNGMIY